ncbi:unnamed protein product [Moneuplotes crassus]|uniref:Uncharacterized protein n=1 Tax=Euplotes crassus TaxID=5936 RepID=A0AAD1UHC8_EUPCR|nr:unnamed protein product [Moneuplotes crassus]
MKRMRIKVYSKGRPTPRQSSQVLAEGRRPKKVASNKNQVKFDFSHMKCRSPPTTQKELPSINFIPSRKPKSCLKVTNPNAANFSSETTSNLSDSVDKLQLPHVKKVTQASKFKQLLSSDPDLSLSNVMDESDSVSNFSDSCNDDILQMSESESLHLNNMLKKKSKGTSEILSMIFDNNYEHNKKSKLTGTLLQDRYESIRDAPKENVVKMGCEELSSSNIPFEKNLLIDKDSMKEIVKRSTKNLKDFDQLEGDNSKPYKKSKFKTSKTNKTNS